MKNFLLKIWDRVENEKTWRLMLWVFLFGLSERLIVSLVLFLRWGWHTVSGIELWFYYGVAKGTFSLYSIWDPTWWILKALGVVFGGELLLYSVFFISSFCSAVNGALFTLLISELHGRKAGFLAGLIYTSMVLPMFNSAGTVTHDIFAEPYIILTLYGAQMFFRRRGWIRLLFAALCLISIFVGKAVGPSVLVSVGAVIIFLLWQGVRAALRPGWKPLLLAAGLTLVFVLALVGVGSRYLFDRFPPAAVVITGIIILASFVLWYFIRRVKEGHDFGASQIIIGCALLLLAVVLLSCHVFGREEGALWSTPVSVWFVLPLGLFALFLMLRTLIKETGDFSHLPVAVFILITLILIVLMHSHVMPRFMEKVADLALQERGVDVRVQREAGSGDLLATSEGDYWLRFNFLIFFLPVGLYMAFRKKDVMGWGMVMAGFLASLAADRGTRPLSFAFAWMGTLALVNWSVALDGVVAAWMGFVTGYFGGRYSTEYAVIFPIAGVLLYLFVQWPRRGEKAGGAALALGSGLVWLVIGSILGGVVLRARQSGNGPLLEQVRKYWTVQSCLLVPILLLFLEALFRKTPFSGSRKGKQLQAAFQWFNREPVKIAFNVAYACFYFGLLVVVFKYIGLLKGKPVFRAGTGLSSLETYVWNNFFLLFPPVVGGLIFLLTRPRWREVNRPVYCGITAVCWLFATVTPSMNQTPKSTEGEYRIYRWLGEHVPREGKILVPWSDGYLAEAVSGLSSELSPNHIDFQLPRFYWMPEEEAAAILKNKGIRYILVSTKYFRLIAYNQKTGEFQYSFSPDIIYQPQAVGVDTVAKLQKTALFNLIYHPQNLKKFRLLKTERDLKSREKENFLVYEINP